MRESRSHRPSPALVVATVALVVAMGGTSYAAFKIGTKNIKNGAVTTAKLHNGAVTGKKIANGAITGSKINLGTLGTVPNANHANRAGSATNAGAVGGQTVTRIFSLVPPGGTTTPIFSADGLTLTESCDGSGNNNINYSSTTTTSELQVEGNDDTSPYQSEHNVVSSGSLFTSGTRNEGNVVINYANGVTGQTVSIALGFDLPSSFNTLNDCAVFGTATSSG